MNEEEKPAIKTELCEAPGGASQIYANYIDVNWTAHDINMRYSHNQRLPAEPPTNRLEHRATVTLSWTEAKALFRLLGDVITRFEALNGEINTPKLP